MKRKPPCWTILAKLLPAFADFSRFFADYLPIFLANMFPISARLSGGTAGIRLAKLRLENLHSDFVGSDLSDFFVMPNQSSNHLAASFWEAEGSSFSSGGSSSSAAELTAADLTHATPSKCHAGRFGMISWRTFAFTGTNLLLLASFTGEIQKGTGGRGRDRICHKLS